MYRHSGNGLLRENGEIAEFDIWADIFSEDVYELKNGVWIEVTNLEPTDTSREHTTTHCRTKTFKKTPKKRSMEQRAKQKKNHRITTVMLDE